MGIMPDRETLEARLSKPVYSRLVPKREQFAGSTVTEFYDFLRQRVSRLTDADIEAELADYLPSDELPGLAMQLSAALTKLH
jgi:hypothetical protein